MSFLAPIFLLGALGIALPIIFHLVRRTPKERIPFSSLMFLKPSIPKVNRKSRLDNVLLLLLRCLILALLALGFARPYLRKDIILPQTGTPARKVVILLDQSASMRRDNLWKDAQAIIASEVNKSTVKDEFALFTFDEKVQAVLSFDQWTSLPQGGRAQGLIAAAGALAPTWFSTHLGTALLTAVERSEDKSETGQGLDREIILISDLQEGARLEGLQGFPWPKGVRVSIPSLKPAHPGNASLQIADRESDTRLKLRVSNVSGGKKEQFKISAEGSTWEDDVYVPIGQTKVFPVGSNVVLNATKRFLLKGDEDPFDNEAFFIAPKTNITRVAYLGEGEADASNPLFYLRPVFRQSQREEAVLTTLSPKMSLDAKTISNLALLIGTDILPTSHHGVLREWISSGKTLFHAPKDRASWASLLALAGLGEMNQNAVVESNSKLVFGQIDFEHPLLAPFADPRYSDFSKIHFWKHLKVELPGSVRVLARFDNGDPALFEIPVGRGRIFGLAGGWLPADSQLALSSKFVPLLYSMLDSSSSDLHLAGSYLIGQPVPLPANSTNLVVQKPDGTSVAVTSTNLFTGTDQPGVYTLQLPQPQAFAVNIDPRESKTAALGLGELERLGVPFKSPEQKLDSKKEKERTQRLLATELESRQKLWRWALVLALLFVLGESALAARISRRIA